MRKIVVAGSLNMDLAVHTGHIPAPGETVLGGELLQSPGGKGANQAYAAARLAAQAKVVFLGCVGQDDFGREMLNNLTLTGCDVSHVQQVAGPSGAALIVVSEQGENAIVVASGANLRFTPEMAASVEHVMDEADSLLLQLEIPLETVVQLAAAARRRGVRVILDPAPAPPDGLPEDLLTLVDILTPNETEAAALSNIRAHKMTPEATIQMAEGLAKRGARGVILKLGAKGSLLFENGNAQFIPAPKVETVDTTAAGDIFNGALAVALNEKLDLGQACWFATRAAAISVTRRGAQLSVPTRKEVAEFH